MGNFLFGQLATEFVFLTLQAMSRCCERLENRSINLASTPSIVECRASAPGDITDLMQTLGQFVAINFRAVIDGPEHIARLQCLPTLLFFIPGCVEQDEVRMQLRIKRA